MVLLYDWKKIYKASKGQTRHIITILDMMVNNRKARSLQDSRTMFYGKDFSGYSYLLNPQDLLKYKHCYSNKEIAEYLALASYRNYSEYVMTGNASLSLLRNPVKIEKLTENRLLQIDTSIKFLFEEVIKEK